MTGMSSESVRHLTLVSDRSPTFVQGLQENAMSALQIIENTRHAMEQALASEDWEALGALDLECRNSVDRVLQDGELVDEARLRENLEALLALYRQMLEKTSTARQAIAAEMSQARQGHAAAKVYMMQRRAGMLR